MIGRDEVLERNGDRVRESAGFVRAKHGALSDADRLGNGPQSTAHRAAARHLFQHSGALEEPAELGTT